MIDAIRRELGRYEGQWMLPDDMDALVEIIETAMGADPVKVEYTSGSAHWVECWRNTSHHACAVAEIERLQEELAQALLNLRGHKKANRQLKGDLRLEVAAFQRQGTALEEWKERASRNQG